LQRGFFELRIADYGGLSVDQSFQTEAV